MIPAILAIASATGAVVLTARTLRRARNQAPVQAEVSTTVDHEGGPQAAAGPAEQESAAHIDRYLAASVASLGIASVGAITAPALGPLSMLGLAYSSVPIFRDGYTKLADERRFGFAALNAVSSVLTVASGFYVATAWGYSLYFIAEKLRQRTQSRSKDALTGIFAVQAPRAVWLLVDGVEVETDFTAVVPGDLIVLRAGDAVPVDGGGTAGFATLDQRMLTGESQPVERSIGEGVLAATTVLSGRLEVQVRQAGSDTIAAGIEEILRQTLDYRSTVELKGDIVAEGLALPTLLLSGAALPFAGPTASIAILNAFAGDTLRVVAPISVLNYLRIASEAGILVKDGRALELIEGVDTVVFDKTGTLTEEIPGVVTVHAFEGTADRVLSHAAAAEARQSHPIARAILEEARRRGIEPDGIEDATYAVGYGLEATLDGQAIRVGSARFMEQARIELPADMASVADDARREGHTLVYVSLGAQLVGAIELRTTIRPEARAIIESLRAAGLSVAIISGDHEEPTRRLARTLGVDAYHAGILPDQKAELIAAMQRDGRSVCFVGDGINDSIALKTAHVSVSLSGASNIATDTAQVILLDGTLRRLPDLFRIANALDRNMRGNLGASLVPSVVTIGGALFFRLGVFAAVSLYNLGLVAGMANAMRPMLRLRSEPEPPDEASAFTGTDGG